MLREHRAAREPRSNPGAVSLARRQRRQRAAAAAPGVDLGAAAVRLLIQRVKGAGHGEAVRYDEFGGIEVLRVEEVERPVPGGGQVLVRVKAAGINISE